MNINRSEVGEDSNYAESSIGRRRGDSYGKY